MQIFGYSLTIFMLNISRRILNIKFIRFLFVGSINTLLSFLIFSFLYFIGFHYFIATTLNLVIGMFISFNTHKHITFTSRSNKYNIYVGFALIFYLITNILLYIADQFNFNIYLSYFVILLPIALFNFLILRRYVFN